MANEEFRTCSRCETTIPKNEFCPSCLAVFKTRRNADDMTGEERFAELKSCEILEIPFDLTHKRIEELVGRPVFTHEIGLNWNGLLEEARSRQHPTLNEVFEMIPEDERIFVNVINES